MYIYGDDFCQHEDASDAKRMIHEVFENICKYFVNNELRIFLVGIKVNQSRLAISFGQKMFVVN